ncbi:hypothetical protein CW304_01625 [Bacillus sp. UFRGS-B20]|nr:hypothetical protein CW304_01625 [Bacillus sp. UFRGS-B20]
MLAVSVTGYPYNKLDYSNLCQFVLVCAHRFMFPLSLYTRGFFSYNKVHTHSLLHMYTRTLYMKKSWSRPLAQVPLLHIFLHL